MEHPWTWSIIHGAAVLAACVGLILFWRTNEDEQQKTLALTRKLSQAEIDRRQFTSELLVNLARRNQSLLYRQLDIINQLEQHEKDPDALGNLFRLDHLATRIRRNAENLIVLSGEEPPRVWGKPVPLTEVVRAAIAETEDLRRVSFSVDERLALMGHAVVDLTHLLAELIENAVRFSPPETQVTVRTTPDVRAPGTVMLTVEDWGVGMLPADLETANQILAKPQEVDASGSTRLGLHVIARLANRYSIKVVLTTTSGSGITAVVLLPPDLFTSIERARPDLTPQPAAITPHPAELTPQPAAFTRQPADLTPQPAAFTAQPAAAVSGPDEPRPMPALPGPQRRADAGLQVQVDNLGRANQWDGWWERNGESVTPESAAPESPIRLTRRIPQTHLAPELQRDHGIAAQSPAAAAPSPSPDAARAREALSRYQASRQAALAEHDPAERTRT
jgi:anti-sigma regulatory factor (Ser/Thr protein kinase)